MHWLHRALCCWLLLVASFPTHAEEASAGVPHLHFKLAPIEIQLGDGLSTAAAHYSKGEWLQAIEHLTAFLKANANHSSSADCHFLLGESLVQLQRYQEAASEFQQLLKLNPKAPQSARAEFRLAEAAMLLGNQSDAIRLLEQFHARYPRHELNAYALPYLAHLVAETQNSNKAISLFSLALQKYPDGPLARECRFRIAMLDYEAGEFVKAAASFQRLLETGDGDQQQRRDALYWLGMAEFRLGKHADAVERFVELGNAPPPNRFAAASLYFAGEAYRKLHQPARAAQLYQLLRDRWPQSEYYSLSISSELKCLRQSQDADRAMELYRQLQRQGDESLGEDGTRLVAEVLLSAQRFVDARQLLRPLVESRRSLSNQEDREQHYQNLYLAALALRGVGQSSQAGELLGRVRVDLASADLAPRVLLARVEVFNESGDFGSAIRTGLTAEMQIPDGRLLDAVRAQLVHAYIKADQLNEAKAKFRQMQQPSTSRDELLRAARWLGEATYAANDFVNARRVFEILERWHQSDEDHAQAVSGLAWIDVKEGNQTSAVARFERFLELFPEHPSEPQTRLALSQSLSTLGRHKPAAEVLTFFEQLKLEHPSRAEGLYRLALLLEHDPHEQVRAEQVAEILVADHTAYQRRDAALYLLGTIQRKSGSPMAEQSFKAIINEHYTSKYWADALYRLGELAAERDDAATAKRYLTKLISSDRDRRVVPHALYLKGKLESKAKSWPEARETLRQLIRDFPESELADAARYGVAESYYQEKNFAHAQRLFDLLEREKNAPTSAFWEAMLRLRRAQLLVRQKQYSAAFNLVKGLAEDFPDFPLQHEADYVLGRASASRGEFTEARKHYLRVIAADPKYRREISAMAQWMIGETHFHQKDFGQAIQAYKPVYTNTTFSEWQAASLLQVGKCYEKLENIEKAKRAYRRVESEFSESRWATSATRRLSVLKGNPREPNEALEL